MCVYLCVIVFTFNFAFGYLVSPHANSGFTVISQTRRTLIPASLSSPTIPERVALDIVWEDSV